MVKHILEDCENQKGKLKSYRNCNYKKHHATLSLGSVAVVLKPKLHQNPLKGLSEHRWLGPTPEFLIHWVWSGA